MERRQGVKLLLLRKHAVPAHVQELGPVQAYGFAAVLQNSRHICRRADIQPYNPSILRLVKMVIDAAHAEGKWVGMCGEMAGDATAIPLLVGLGLDEFSMSATSILPARSQISKLSADEMGRLATQALGCSTAEEVVRLVQAINV